MSKEKSEFAVRMKSYESKEKLDANLPICVRLDGRSFSKFTKHYRKPFDDELTNAFEDTTVDLMREFSFDLGYTQSDEISLFWERLDDESLIERPFGAKIQKLVSVLSSYCTGKFISHLESEDIPQFDCRIFNVPSDIEQANALLLRYKNCYKNAHQSVVHHLLDPKLCKGMKLKDQIAYIDSVDYEILDHQKYGTIVHKELRCENIELNFQKCYDLLRMT